MVGLIGRVELIVEQRINGAAGARGVASLVAQQQAKRAPGGFAHQMHIHAQQAVFIERAIGHLEQVGRVVPAAIHPVQRTLGEVVRV